MPEYEEDYTNFIDRIGEPVAIRTYIAVSHVTQYFTLGGGDDTGDDYDWDGDTTDEAAPFEDKMIQITSMEIIAPTAGSASVGYCIVDGKDILAVDIAGGASFEAAGWKVSCCEIGPHLADIFGGPIYMRRRIGIRAPATDEIEETRAHALVKIWGFVVDRRF